MSSTAQASIPARVAVRWYQVAVLVLALALAAVTALAVYFAVTAPAIPPFDSGTGTPGTVAEQPCYQPQVPC